MFCLCTSYDRSFQFLAHIFPMLQLRGLMPRKVHITLDVVCTTKWGWQDPCLPFTVCATKDFHMQLVSPYLKLLRCKTLDTAIKCQHSVLWTAAVSVLQRTIVLANYRKLPKRFCGKKDQPADVESAIAPKSHQPFRTLQRARCPSPLYRNSRTILPTIVKIEVASPSHTRRAPQRG